MHSHMGINYMQVRLSNGKYNIYYTPSKNIRSQLSLTLQRQTDVLFWIGGSILYCHINIYCSDVNGYPCL